MSQHEMDRPTLGQIHHYYAHAALLNADFGSYLFKSNGVIFKIRRLKSMTRSFISDEIECTFKNNKVYI